MGQIRGGRFMCAVAGMAGLGAAANATIEYGGGDFTSPYSVMIMAMTAMVGVGALSIGAARMQGRYPMVFLLAFLLCCCEAFGLINTAIRIANESEAASAPVRAANAAREQAQARLERARVTVASLQMPSPRLKRALSAKKEIDATIAAKAAERGCASNCRKLLEQQIADAAAEVKAAREALEIDRRRAAMELKSAREDLAALPPLRSDLAIANYLGIPAWTVLLAAAALGSLGLNGMAAALLAFAGHGWDSRPKDDTILHPPPALGLVDDPRDHVTQFARARIRPNPSAQTPLIVLLAHYDRWCIASHIAPLPEGAAAQELCLYLRDQGYSGKEIDGEPYLIGLSVSPAETALVRAA